MENKKVIKLETFSESIVVTRYRKSIIYLLNENIVSNITSHVVFLVKGSICNKTH